LILKQIIKSKTFGMKEFFFDSEDLQKVNMYQWHLQNRGPGRNHNLFYVATNIEVDGKRTILLLHRHLIDAPDDLKVNHINRNSLDNRKENLRLASPIQIMQTVIKHKGKDSVHKGICKRSRKWEVYITVNKKRIYLGTRVSEIEAAKLYNENAIKYFGEFAQLNKIEEDKKCLITK